MGLFGVTETIQYVHNSGTSSSSAAEEIVSSHELDAEVVMLLEDIPVKLGDKTGSARAFWDDGSNRILINSSYAKKLKLRSQPVSYRLDGICGSDKVDKGMVYEL